MKDLDAFTLAYIECALWSSTDNADESGGQPLDEHYSIDDIADETLATMVDDCAEFQESFAGWLAQARGPAQNGHDFWLTRNRHGAGFWGRGHGKIGEDLTEAAHYYGEVNLFVGDDGRIYS